MNAGQLARKGIVSYPSYRLLRRSDAVTPSEFSTPTYMDRIKKLAETVSVLNGVCACGPKLDWNARVILLGDMFGGSKFDYFVNPTVTWKSDNMCGMWENCMSMDSVAAWVVRPNEIFIASQDEHGVERKEQMSGIRCRLFMHEFQHLEGLSLIDDVESRDFLVTGANAISQRSTWPKDFPSKEAYMTPQFMLYDFKTGTIQRIPEFEAYYSATDKMVAEKSQTGVSD